MIKLSLLVGLLWASTSYAGELKCFAFQIDEETNKAKRVEFKQASFDPLFYQAKMGEIGFGVDTYYLEKSDGVGVVIIDEKTHLAATGTVSFLKKASGDEFRHTLYVPKGNGYRLVYQIACFR